MTTAWCVIDAHAGTIARYEMGGSEPLRSHFGEANEDYPRPVTFSLEFVEEFRLRPHPDFYCGGQPWRPNDDGGSPAAARAA